MPLSLPVTLSDHVGTSGWSITSPIDSRVSERGPDRTRPKPAGSMLRFCLTNMCIRGTGNTAGRGLATPDYQQPMQTDLLWVYEGLTNYLGNILAARSGLWTPEDFRQSLAGTAADLDHLPGRTVVTCRIRPTPRLSFISLRTRGIRGGAERISTTKIL